MYGWYRDVEDKEIEEAATAPSISPQLPEPAQQQTTQQQQQHILLEITEEETGQDW